MRTAASNRIGAAVSFWIIFCALILSGCAGRDDWREHAISMTAGPGFAERIVNAPPFEIFALVKNKNTAIAAPWRVYIEGDGRAFVNYELSMDPTPSQTTLIDLMLTDSAPNILYLARPCQFISSDACDAKYWSNARYGEDVLKSMQTAITEVAGQAPVELIGYSGGGTVATLLAARMPAQTIIGVRTIAANLSVKEQTAYFGLSPLDQSLDPINYTDKLRAVPQIHLVASSDDKVIPLETVQLYQRILHSACAQFIELSDVTHQGPWEKPWKQWENAAFQSCGL